MPEAPAAEISAPAAPSPVPPMDATGPRLTFRDQVAVRIAVYVGVAAGVLGLILPFVSWLAAGFFAVYIYRRRTGRPLDVNAGVHMGWITGLAMFPLPALIFAFDVISGGWGARLLEQMKKGPIADPALQRQMVQFFQSGPGMAVAIGFMFLLITGLSIAGGALGAKVSGRNSG